MGESPWKFESSRPHQTVPQGNQISPLSGLPVKNGAVLRGFADWCFQGEARDTLQAQYPSQTNAEFSVPKNPASLPVVGMIGSQASKPNWRSSSTPGDGHFADQQGAARQATRLAAIGDGFDASYPSTPSSLLAGAAKRMPIEVGQMIAKASHKIGHRRTSFNCRLKRSDHRRGFLDGSPDAHIGCAAAQIAAHRVVDGSVIGRRVVSQQSSRRHDLA